MTKHKVVLVPFPFDDLSGTKVRPAVCLSEPIGPYRHVVLAFITSQVSKSPLPSDLVLDAGDFRLCRGRFTGLIHASVAPPDDSEDVAHPARIGTIVTAAFERT